MIYVVVFVIATAVAVWVVESGSEPYRYRCRCGAEVADPRRWGHCGVVVSCPYCGTRIVESG